MIQKNKMLENRNLLIHRSITFCILLWIPLLVALPALPGYTAELLRLNTASAMMVDATRGRVLFYQDIERPIPPASLTKILSLYMAYEALREGRIHKSDMVKISNRAWLTGGTRMFLNKGTEVPLDEIIKGMSIVSANDASIALAEHIGGSVEHFVEMMNAKARELGMADSHFMNPNGLPAKGQITTARDLMKLSRAYIQHYPEALGIHSQAHYTYYGITQRNRNRLLGTCPGVDGVKTGHIFEAGYNIIVTAKRGDTRLIAVLLGARTPRIRQVETTRLVEMGFQMVGGKL
ncbi:MAG: D-alanyl-D-alanine carboxypeptidase family protein [Syntrophales bacterium]|jgi:D-alanyl-D-alanine carboxypeptidase (penicillin-binding protein 5/6)